MLTKSQACSEKVLTQRQSYSTQASLIQLILSRGDQYNFTFFFVIFITFFLKWTKLSQARANRKSQEKVDHSCSHGEK